MSLKDQSTLRIVLYEGDGAQPLEAADRFAAMSALLEKGFAVTRVAGGGRVAPADRTTLLVLGRFNGGSAPFGENAEVNIRFRDLNGFEASNITGIVESVRAEAPPDALREAVENATAGLAGDCDGLQAKVQHLEHFRPGKPQPTHRITSWT